jgi:hypothetical protein
MRNFRVALLMYTVGSGRVNVSCPYPDGRALQSGTGVVGLGVMATTLMQAFCKPWSIFPGCRWVANGIRRYLRIR